jgi:hypothetical protein
MSVIDKTMKVPTRRYHESNNSESLSLYIESILNLQESINIHSFHRYKHNTLVHYTNN